MAIRKALVVGVDGLSQQLQAADTLNTNAKFTGSAIIPAFLVLGTNSVSFTVAPVVSGDALAVGEPIDAYATGADLPAGVIVGQARVTAPNTVKLTFIAVLAVSVTSVAWTIVAHR